MKNSFIVLLSIVGFLMVASSPKKLPAQGGAEYQNTVAPGAQNPNFKSEIDSVNTFLLNLAKETIGATTNQERILRNAIFSELLENTLLGDSMFANDLNSVINISVLYDDSRRFRIVTWYVPLFDGTAVFHGFFQTPSTAGRRSKLVGLNDRSQQVDARLQRRLDPQDWYGAYYYKLIRVQHLNLDNYVLLGWKADNPLTRKRIIEPLIITQDGPAFGDRVFEIGEHRPFRVVFEYSRQVSMSLDFEPSYSKSRNEVVPAIVFDRLVPTHKSMAGRYEHYVPEVNVFDGMEFHQGFWRYVPDIDVRVNLDPSLRPLRRQ